MHGGPHTDPPSKTWAEKAIGRAYTQKGPNAHKETFFFFFFFFVSFTFLAPPVGSLTRGRKPYLCTRNNNHVCECAIWRSKNNAKACQNVGCGKRTPTSWNELGLVFDMKTVSSIFGVDKCGVSKFGSCHPACVRCKGPRAVERLQ